MGRPSLGNQARNIQKGTKVSRDEIEWLETLHGSAHKGLRAALDFYKLQQLRHSSGEAAQDYVEALERFSEPTWVPPADYRPTVDVELPEPAPAKAAKVKVAVPRPVVPVDEEGTPIPCRIHREWTTLAEFYDKGVAMREKRCTKCGHVVVERAA